MRTENVLTAEKFIQTWQVADTSQERLEEEIESVFNETHRKNDDFFMYLIDGAIVDPKTKRKVDFERETQLQRQEGEAFDNLKKLADEKQEGSFIWISPKLDDVYPCNKVVFYEIAYTFEFPPKKVLLSTAILFDSDKNGILEIANSIDSEKDDVGNIETLRSEIFELPQNYDLPKLLDLITTVKESEISALDRERVSFFARQIRMGGDPRTIAAQMQQDGLLGSFSVSCKPSLGLMGYLSQFSMKINLLSKKEKWSYDMGVCRDCHEYTKVGPCKICIICEGKYN